MIRFLKLGVALAILVLSTVAFANTVQITFTGTAPENNVYAPTGTLTYPYYGNVNGVPTDYPFMCISYNEHITGGESWYANVFNTVNFGVAIGDHTLAEELAFLYGQVPFDPGYSDGSINAEAWYLFEGVPIPEPNAGIMAYFDPNQKYAATFYVPVGYNLQGSRINPDGMAQILVNVGTGISQTPEPSTLLMLGSGVLGLAGLARKRLLN